MNVAENLLLKQMQNMASLPKTGNNSGSKDQAGSFQDMMDQAGQDTAVDTGKDSGTTEQPKPVDKSEKDTSQTPVQNQKKDGEETEEPVLDPNAAAYVMDIFRPEIVEVQPEAVAEVPVEAVEMAVPVEEAAVEVPVMETAAPVQEEAAPAAEVPVEVQPETVAEKAPEAVTETERPVETAEQSAPRETVVENVEKTVDTTDTGEVQDVQPVEETAEDEPQGDAAELTNHVFHDVKAAPVKVAENYRTVDTEAPDLDGKLANTIIDAAQNGVEKMQIQLTPANLGQITIDLTRNTDGALEVVIHAATGKAAGLLNQHLDGLHAALQTYGNNQPVHVEVQRGQEGQEQHMFQHADPDGRGQQQRQQQENRQETEDSGEDFLQKLRLGLTGLE